MDLFWIQLFPQSMCVIFEHEGFYTARPAVHNCQPITQCTFLLSHINTKSTQIHYLGITITAFISPPLVVWYFMIVTRDTLGYNSYFKHTGARLKFRSFWYNVNCVFDYVFVSIPWIYRTAREVYVEFIRTLNESVTLE